MCCQVLFFIVQNSFGQKIIESTSNQLRQELNFSNFHYLARSITDYTQSGAIRCSKLEKVSPDYFQVIDLSYMGKRCMWPTFLLQGARFNVSLKSLNGDVYQFYFVNNNPIYFDLTLWGFRILGLIAILGVFFAQREKIKYAQRVHKIATQLSHDIRSPLAVLSEGIKDNFSNPELMKQAVARIEGIANDLLKERKKDLPNHQSQKILDLIQTIIEEKKIQFKNKSPEFVFSEIGTLSLDVPRTDLSRLLSNLLNNAIESSEIPEIKIDVTETSISISDNGAGIPKDVLEKLGKVSITTKKSGNGIGLISAVEKMTEWKGKLVIASEVGKGTKITLDFFPSANPSSSWTVLVDDDALIRLTWESKAKSKSIPFKTFSTSEELLQNLNNLSKDTVFYLDLEIKGSALTGDELAKQLQEKGFHEIYLASGHDTVSDEIMKHFKGKHSKKCPF